MPRHSPYALVRLNLTFASSSLYELLEFHKTNNCYSVSLFSEKVLSFSFSIDLLHLFGEIVILPKLERPLIDLAVSL